MDCFYRVEKTIALDAREAVVQISSILAADDDDADPTIISQ